MYQHAQNAVFNELKSGSDPILLADNLIDEYFGNMLALSHQLISVLLNCSNYAFQIPIELVNEGVVSNIVAFLQQLISNDEIDKTTHFIINSKGQRVLCFFEQVWVRMLAVMANDDPFNFLFLEFVNETCHLEINSLRSLSILVKLKLSTAVFIKHPPGFNIQIHLMNMIDSSTMALYKSVLDVNRQVLMYSLKELKRWFRAYPQELINDKMLRFVIWPLRFNNSNIICCGLDILQSLLNLNASLLNDIFIKKACNSIYNLVRTTNNQVFTLFCKCVSKMAALYPNLVPEMLLLTIQEEVFSFTPTKAKIAAAFWISIHCNGATGFENLRRIICFVRTRHIVFWELFADAFFEDFPIIKDWNLIARCLTEDNTLSNEEKADLFSFTLFILNQEVTMKRPSTRYVRSGEEKWNETASQEITAAFSPFLSRFFNSGYIPLANILKMISYFNFDFMKKEISETFMDYIYEFFSRDPTAETRLMCLDVIVSAMTRTVRNTFKEKGKNNLGIMKKSLENDFTKLYHDILLLNFDSSINADLHENVCSVLCPIMLVDTLSPIKKEIAYFIAMDIIQKPLPEVWNPAELFLREMLITLITRYIVRLIENEESLGSSLRYTQYVVFHLVSQLDISYEGRIGEVSFYNLCELMTILCEKSIHEEVVVSVIQELPFYILAILQEDCPMKCARKEAIVKRYLELIIDAVCPLEWTYDLLKIYCLEVDEPKYEDILEAQLFSFVAVVTRKYDTISVINWMFHFLLKVFTFTAKKYTLKTAKACEQLKKIGLANKDSIAQVLVEVHLRGIDFAVSSPDNVDFFLILAMFSSLSNFENLKKICMAFNNKKVKYNEGDPPKTYLKSLTRCLKRKASRALSPLGTP